MKLTLKRIACKPTYTIGKLYIDGQYFCDTIEDRDRGLTNDMPLVEIKKKKVYGETAIPRGVYGLTMNVISPKYSKKKNFSFTGGRMPRLLNIPGWEGVLIHSGNTASDSLGCIVVGENKVVGKVINSFATFKRLWPILDAHRNEPMSIEIVG